MMKVETWGSVMEFLIGQTIYSPEEILGKRRHRDLVWARRFVMFYLHELGLSANAIGSLMNRNHATVLEGLNVYGKWERTERKKAPSGPDQGDYHLRTRGPNREILRKTLGEVHSEIGRRFNEDVSVLRRDSRISRARPRKGNRRKFNRIF